MRNSITRLSPRRGSFEKALVAFRAARLQVCLSELNGIDTIAAATLRARVLLRLGNPESALAAALAARAETTCDPGVLTLLCAVAYSRLGRDDDAESALVAARVCSISAADIPVEAEVEFYWALRDFGNGDLEGARTGCLRGLDVSAHLPPPTGRRSRIVPLAHVVSRTQELLGLIKAAAGQYRGWLKHARAALATLDDCAIPDVFQEAFAVKNLAILVRDFDLEDDAQTIATRAGNLAWTPDISRPQFVTFEALGWCAALRGDSVAALGRFREASEAASTLPEQIMSAVNRTIIARELGCRPIALEELQYALRLSESCDWENAVDDYRVVLLSLAQAAAATAPARAREALNRYSRIRTAMDGTFATRIEARVRAEETYTHGVVLRAEGRLDASADKLRAAFATWSSIGYQWRAGRAALELAELNAGDVFRLAVRRELRRRPESVFATRARSAA